MTCFLMDQSADNVLWLLLQMMHLLKLLVQWSRVWPMFTHSEHICVVDLQCFFCIGSTCSIWVGVCTTLALLCVILVLIICSLTSRILDAVVISVQMIWIRCVYCLVFKTSDSSMQWVFFNLFIFFLFRWVLADVWVKLSYEDGLLRCSGRNTGEMLILLKCSTERVEV